MKAERRHELQNNILANWLAEKLKAVQPHANTILIGTLLVIGAIVAVVMLSGRTSDRSASAWSEYYQATLLEDGDKRITELAGVADKNPDSTPGLWARLMAGEARLARGSNVYFKDRTKGREDLDLAQLDFEAVIKGGAKLPKAEREWLLQRAHWGLARTFETLAMADEAQTQYETLAKTWPEEPLGKAAAEQSRQLKLMTDWYEWYASVDPESIKPSATQEGFPGGIPGGFPSGFPGGDSGGFNHGTIPMERPPENDTGLGFDPSNPLGLGTDDLDFGTGSENPPADDPPADDPSDEGSSEGAEATPPEGSGETVPESSGTSDEGEASEASESGDPQP